MHTAGDSVPVRQDCTPDTIKSILRKVKPWKAPGPDGIPAGLLKACGDPLLETLSHITNASFKLATFPRCFRDAQVVVIKKPGKAPAEAKKPNAWRPISLLSCVGKVIEAAMAELLGRVAEEHQLLPEG